jgi:hypothetical protein
VPAAYRAAIDLYAGELLPQDRYEAWAEQRRAELRGLYLWLLVDLASLLEGRRELGEAIEALGRVVEEDPTHEGAHVGLMRLYAFLGRRREALGHYERLRDALFGEFGSEPEAATARLHEEIWAGTFPHSDSPPAAGFSPEQEAPTSPAGAARRHNLPLARTSFVGREHERLEVKRRQPQGSALMVARRARRRTYCGAGVTVGGRSVVVLAHARLSDRGTKVPGEGRLRDEQPHHDSLEGTGVRRRRMVGALSGGSGGVEDPDRGGAGRLPGASGR